MKKETAEELCVAMNNITTKTNQKVINVGSSPRDYRFTAIEVAPNLWGIDVALGESSDAPLISVEELIMSLLLNF
jgi:hypothetical protein